MLFRFAQQVACFIGPFLLQYHFEEDTRVYENSHFSPILHSRILCWSSTDVYLSRRSRKAPFQWNLGFPLAFGIRFSIRNRTKSSTSCWSSGGNSLIMSATFVIVFHLVSIRDTILSGVAIEVHSADSMIPALCSQKTHCGFGQPPEYSESAETGCVAAGASGSLPPNCRTCRCRVP